MEWERPFGRSYFCIWKCEFMKKLNYLIVIILYFIGIHCCNACQYYDEELFMPVGAYFKMDTQSDVHYAVVDGAAKVVLSERGKEVYLYKLGKVIVQASYYVNGDYKLPYQRR